MSEVRTQKPHGDIEPVAAQGETISQNKHGDPDVQKDKYCMFSPHIFPTPPRFRITEDGSPRITENGFFRILEAL